MIVGVETSNCSEVSEFIINTSRRYNSLDAKVHFFVSDFSIKYFLFNGRIRIFFFVNYGVPPVQYLSILFFFLAFFWKPFLSFCIPFLLFGFFVSRYWFYFVVVRGLRRAGYVGKTRFLSDKEGLRGVLFGSG